MDFGTSVSMNNPVILPWLRTLRPKQLLCFIGSEPGSHKNKFHVRVALAAVRVLIVVLSIDIVALSLLPRL